MSCKHCHGEEHCEVENHEKTNSKVGIILYGIAIVLLIASFIPALVPIQVILITGAILLSGYELLITGIKNIFKLNFEEDTLMTIAVIAAFCLGEYVESCLVILLYRLGEFLEDRAVDKSQESIKEIVNIKADTANKLIGNEIEVVDVKQIQIGDTILIKPGEKIPVDVMVLSGTSTVDTSAITGESTPLEIGENEELLSGGINLIGALTAKVLRDAEHSTASQIVDLVYEASNNKGKTEKFITRFSKIYTPCIILLAVLIAIIPASLGYLDFPTWINRALIFLVASCPCSLVIAVPLSFFSCVGAISKKGMIIKGTKHIENLAKATVVAFDKTGTLTTGKMKIEQIEVITPYTKEQVIQYINSLEQLSNHPISTAIQEYRKDLPLLEVTDYSEIAGHGLIGTIQGNSVLFGGTKLLEKYQIQTNVAKEDAIYLVINQQVAGYITLTEDIRQESIPIKTNLKKVGIKKVIMLTGDNQVSAEKIASKMNLQDVRSGLLPQNKLNVIKQLKQQGEKVIFVGDGINDSPVLAASDFGIAMGAGTQIASSTADSILISNRIGSLPTMIRLAQRSMNIIHFNIIFSLVVKAIVLTLGFFGLAPIWAAILADTGVTFLTVVNSMRIFKM